MTSRILAALLIAGTAAAQPARPARADLLVTPSWLAEHLNEPHLVLLHMGDSMNSKERYAKAHIPGATYMELDDVSISSMNHVDSLMLEMPSPELLRQKLVALGISDDSRIVVYPDGDDISQATRVMLTLDYAGFGARSSLLDGGLNAWNEAHRPVTAAVTTHAAGKLSPLRVNPVVTDLAWLRPRVGTLGLHLVDGRAGAFYDGLREGMKPGRKGHIPGAHNIPFTSVTDDKGHLKPADELTKLFAAAGISGRDTVVAYCHIGQQATAVLFAARTLGHPVLLYDGSFQEWGRRTDLPVELPKQ